jgi:ABC-type antimicrobial peptide transport system permease subunit
MIRKQANIIRLSLDNVMRRWKVYLLLVFAVAIGTAIILFLLLSAEGLQRTARSNLMRLPLNKLWIRPGLSKGSETEVPDIAITSELIQELTSSPDIVKVWPQTDYSRASYVELVIQVLMFRRDFSSIVEIYGVHDDLIKVDLFEGESFEIKDGKIPVIFPAAVVNMLNNQIARKILPEGKKFKTDVIRNFNVNLYLEMDRKSGKTGFKQISCRAVGVSSQIPQIGVAVPIETVKKWNLAYGGQTGEQYSRVLVETVDPEQASLLSRKLDDRGYTIESSRETFESIQQIFKSVQIAVGVFGILIIISVGVGLFNGMNLVVYSERDIIGVMRAVGAKGRDILEGVLLQAVWIGIAGGLLGTACAFVTAFAVEGYLVSLLKNYSITAEHLFSFNWIMCIGGVCIPPAVCMMFGLLPALRAVTLKPAEVLK